MQLKFPCFFFSELKGIVNKLLHGPMTHMRATENLEKSLAALKTLKAVFEI